MRGSYSQITEFRAEKEQFVPRAGSYSLPYSERPRWIGLSPYGGVILSMIINNQEEGFVPNK